MEPCKVLYTRDNVPQRARTSMELSGKKDVEYSIGLVKKILVSAAKYN